MIPLVSHCTRDEITFAGQVYMRRWYPPGGHRERYHEILHSDPGRALHDHPWNFTSTILDGAYLEITPDGERLYRAGAVIYRKATDLHRLEVIEGPVWTHVTTSRVLRQWGFATDDGWVPYDRYDYAGDATSRF